MRLGTSFALDDTHLLQDLLELPSLMASGELDATLRRVAELALAHVQGVDEIGVSLVHDGRIETGVWIGESVCRIDGAQYDNGEGPCLDAIRHSRVEEVADLTTEDRWPAFAAAALEHGMHGSLSLPLVADGQPLGALNLYARKPQAFSDESLRIGLPLAEYAATSLANARAYAEASKAVLTLQRSLLPPRLPSAPGFQLASRYLPATSGSNVGGDWYDSVLLRDGCLAATIGDVSGHGLTAASVMGQMRIALRAYTVEGHTPALALTLLHQLFSELESETFATACALDLDDDGDPRGVLARVATAGHPEPLVIPPSGPPHYLTLEPGAPVGAPQVDDPVELRARLPRGSVVVLFTDGLVERRGRSLDDGLRRLAEAARSGPLDLEALCEHLLAALLDDDSHEDDIALLAIRAGADS